MRRDTRELRWVLLLFVLTAPFVLRAPRSPLPGEDYVHAGAALLLRPALLLQEFGGARAVALAAEEDPLEGAPGRATRAALDAALEEQVLAADVAARFAALPRPRVPCIVEVRRARARRSGTRPTLLDLALPHVPEFATALAGSPVVVGESLVGFVDAEPGPRGELVVRSLADRPVRGTGQRVIALAESAADPSLPAIKLVVEGAGATERFPLRAFLTTPRHFDTWSEGRHPFVARTTASADDRELVPQQLRLGIVEDWGYLERDFVLTRYLQPDWDARSLVRVVLFVPPELRGQLESWRAQREHAPRLPMHVAWEGPAGLTYRDALGYAPGLEPGAGLFAGEQLCGIVRAAAFGLVFAEALGSRGQQLPALARVPGRAEIVPLLVEGQGLVPGGARLRVVWPEELAISLRGAELFSGVRGEGLPSGWRLGTVYAHQGRTLHVERVTARTWPEGLFAFAPSARREAARTAAEAPR